jgi:hypothetical protein
LNESGRNYICWDLAYWMKVAETSSLDLMISTKVAETLPRIEWKWQKFHLWTWLFWM